jgi:hypothetical protein
MGWRDALKQWGEQIELDVDQAPPLTDEQRAVLTAIFAPAVQAANKGPAHPGRPFINTTTTQPAGKEGHVKGT